MSGEEQAAQATEQGNASPAIEQGASTAPAPSSYYDLEDFPAIDTAGEEGPTEDKDDGPATDNAGEPAPGITKADMEAFSKSIVEGITQSVAPPKESGPAKEQAPARDFDAEVEKLNSGLDTLDADLERLEKDLDEGDITLAEYQRKAREFQKKARAVQNDILKVEKDRLAADFDSKMSQALSKRDAESESNKAVAEWLKDHKDFLEFQKSGKLEEIKKQDPLHDDLSAYYALKAQEQYEAGLKEGEEKAKANRDAKAGARSLGSRPRGNGFKPDAALQNTAKFGGAEEVITQMIERNRGR